MSKKATQREQSRAAKFKDGARTLSGVADIFRKGSEAWGGKAPKHPGRKRSK